MSKADSDFIEQARARHKLADEATSKQRERENEDLAFYGGDQWPSDIVTARGPITGIAGLPDIPARVTLTVNKVREPVRQVLNQERSSDIGVELVPADDFGDLGITPDDTEVTLREGLIRRIQRESKAQDARTWAYARATIAGQGYYMVMTRYLPGKTNDQEVYIHRIYNQGSVLLDPSHEQPDGSDAQWGFMGVNMLWDRYCALYPKAANGKKNHVTDSTDTEWVTLTESYPKWFSLVSDEDGKNTRRSVHVEDYWYIETKHRELVTLDSGETFWADEVELPDGVEPTSRRSVPIPTVKWCKLDGAQELEKTDWPGQTIPIIKVMGEELQPYDDERRAEGMVRPAIGPARGFNHMVSKLVEMLGGTPLQALILDPEAIRGYEDWYAQMNTRPLPFLPAHTYDDQGRQLKEPHRPSVDPNVLPIAQAIGLFDAAIKSTTAMPDSTLGNVDPTLRSKVAIDAVVANAAQSTSNFMDNLARSVRYEGEIVNDLLYPIYGTKPGRLLRILTGEGDQDSMRVTDGNDPQANPQVMGPQAGPQGLSQGMGLQRQPSMQQKAQKVAKLTKDAHFNVIVKVAKNYDSRRNQEATIIAELLNASPILMTWFGDLFFKNQDGPGHKQMAERAKVMLDPKIQNMLAQQESGQQPLPPDVQAKLAEMAERIKHGEAAMQELNQQIETKQVEQQAKIVTEQLKAVTEKEIETLKADRDMLMQDKQLAHEIELQRMKSATELAKAEMSAGLEGHLAAHEAMAQHEGQAQEIALQQDQQDHERDMAARQMALAATQGEADQEHETSMAEMGHQQALEQNEQAAMLAPEPEVQ